MSRDYRPPPAGPSSDGPLWSSDRPRGGGSFRGRGGSNRGGWGGHEQQRAREDRPGGQDRSAGGQERHWDDGGLNRPPPPGRGLSWQGQQQQFPSPQPPQSQQHQTYSQGHQGGYGGGLAPGGYPSHPQQHQPWPAQPGGSQPYQHQPPHQAYYAQHEPSPGPSAGPSHARAVAETPSASVVLLGLPVTCTDQQLRFFLEDMGSSIDQTTVIIDRATGLSKRYGFAKFSSVEHARAFVEPNFPTVKWRERGMNGQGKDDGMVIKINYSQKTGGWREDQGAGARMTDDQRKADEPQHAPQSFHVNDGTRDVGSAPTQILLLRDLDALTIESDIFSALAAIPSRVGDDIRLRGGLKRVYIVRDRGSRTSWGFGFVQLSDVKLASDVLSQTTNGRVFPHGFRIRQNAVAVSFSHSSSFLPVYKKSDWSFAGEGGQQLAYWDDKAFVTAWTPSATVPSAPATPTKKAPASATISALPTEAPAQEDDDDMDDFFASLDADHPPEKTDDAGGIPGLKTLPAVAAAEPKPAEPSMPTAPKALVIKSLVGSGSEARIKAMAQSPSQAAPAKQAIHTPIEPMTILGEKKKGGGELIYSRKAAPNIAKWNVKAQELKLPEAPPAPPAISPSNATPTAESTPEAGSSSLATEQPGEGTAAKEEEDAVDLWPHADPVKFVCLLCQRQFKSIPELEKHNKLSALHKTNLANPDSLAACATRKAATLSASRAASSTPVDSPAESSAPKYVDRAAARREAFHQPDEPPRHAKKRKVFDGPAPPNVPVSAVVEEIEESNVGRGMLEKMGWTKGVGLGAGGTGRVDPVAAAQYVKGVGLGAAKGVVVGAAVDSPSSHAEAMREKARARMAENARHEQPS